MQEADWRCLSEKMPLGGLIKVGDLKIIKPATIQRGPWTATAEEEEQQQKKPSETRKKAQLSE